MKIKIGLCLLVTLIIFLQFACEKSTENDWTTYRYNARRNAISPAPLSMPLALKWVHQSKNLPRPAWMPPGEELPRMHEDNVFQPIVAKNTVYFGSSADHQLYALDLETGRIKWTFYAGGPIRFAPSFWQDQLYFGADDGNVYCLDADDGDLEWQFHPGPREERIIGNGQMISRWPIRTSVLVDDGVVYLGAGVFPYEGIYICALDAENGKIIWKNDNVGNMAHELQYGGITPHGYLLASAKFLYVPAGRAMPAVFDRATGEFRHFLNPGGKVGGSWGLVSEETLYAGSSELGDPAKVMYAEGSKKPTGDAFAAFDGIDLLLSPEIAYTLTEEGVFAIRRANYDSLQSQIDANQAVVKRLTGIINRLKKHKLVTPEQEKKIAKYTTRIRSIVMKEDSLKQAGIQWNYAHENLNSLIKAGNSVILGGDSVLIAVDATTGKESWREKVAGDVFGLAAAENYLVVSTTAGKIYGFSTGGAGTIPEVAETSFESDEFYADAATQILQQTGKQKGYCLVLDSETGQLAAEIARQSALQVIGLSQNPASVREWLSAAGLYGERVIIEPWTLQELPDYFADLIVSESGLKSGDVEIDESEIYRILKPYGGTLFWGQPADEANFATNDLVNRFLKFESLTTEVLQKDGTWLKIRRGALKGAGGWTHQYANLQNTACSDESLVEFPLGVLWFGEPGPEFMVERHAKAAAPVALDGRMFIQGEHVIWAYDSYNGTLLWKREIAGAVRTRADVDGGNLALNKDGLFVAAKDHCYHLNPATGETIRLYRLPAGFQNNRRWGFIGCSDNTLYGSASEAFKQQYRELWDEIYDPETGTWKDPEKLEAEVKPYSSFMAEMTETPEPDKMLTAFQRDGTEWRFQTDYPNWNGGIRGPEAAGENLISSDAVFAYDLETGKLKWLHRGRKISNISITIGNNEVYFVESQVSLAEKATALSEQKRLGRAGIWVEEETPRYKPDKPDVRLVQALNANTGKLNWQRPLDLTGCGGDALATAVQDNILFFFGSYGLHDKWRYAAAQLTWHRVTAIATDTQEVLWSRPQNYMTRPLVLESRLIIEPRAAKLHSGEVLERQHPVTGETIPWEFFRPGHTCAGTAATQNGLFYRSYNAAFYDLENDQGITYFGAIRPGCWINMVPANGVLLFPEASAGCTCSFPLRSTVVLKTRPQQLVEDWQVYVLHGAATPVKHLRLNLGAPGDKRDTAGQMWFGYPRPDVKYGLRIDLSEKFQPGGGFFSRQHQESPVKNNPWLYANGALGLESCELPLIDDQWGEAPGVYTVRLGFAAPPNENAGQRIFSIKIQGETVATDFDIAAASEQPVIRQFERIPVQNKLKLEFIPQEPNPDISEMPLVHLIEVIREDKPAEATAASRLSETEAKKLHAAAWKSLKANKKEDALRQFHQLFDGAPDAAVEKLALDGMAELGKMESISRIAKYCKETDPLALNFELPDSLTLQSATRALVAVAMNLASDNRERAVQLLDHAFKIASTLELREQIIRNYHQLGIEINKSAVEQGFLTHWQLIGPFVWDQGKETLNEKYINEPEIKLSTVTTRTGKQLDWLAYVSDKPMIDLRQIYGELDMVAAYGFTEFELEQAQNIIIQIGSNDGFKCWFNKNEIGRFDGGRGWSADQNSYQVPAKKGKNQVLMKISQLGDAWGFSVRLTDLKDNPIVVKQ